MKPLAEMLWPSEEESRQWTELCRLKQAAHAAIAKAKREGRWHPKPCEVCGSTKQIAGHHDDYTKPLEVRWLCHTHHMGEHAKLRRK